MKKGRILAVALFLAVLVTMVSGCSTSSATKTASKSSSKVYKIVLVAKQEGIPWFDDMRKGVEQFAKDNPGKVKAWQVAPEGGDAAKQVQMVNDLIAQGVDAIVVVPIDPNAMRPVLQQAKQKGIVLISHEAPHLTDVVNYDVEAFDNAAFGEQMFKELAQAMGGEGQFAAMVGGLTMETHMAWYNAGMAYLKKNYPKMQAVSAQPYEDNNDDKTARDKSLEILNAYPNLKGFVGTSVSAGSNMASVLKEKGNKNVKVVSLGIPSVSCPYIEQGYMVYAQTWRPADAGYVACLAAYRVLQGQTVKTGDNFVKSGYDKVTVSSDKVIRGNAPLEMRQGSFPVGKYPF